MAIVGPHITQASLRSMIKEKMKYIVDGVVKALIPYYYVIHAPNHSVVDASNETLVCWN